MNYIDRLEKMGACAGPGEAIPMLRAAGHRTLQQAWDAWERGEHMIWLLCRVWKDYPPCAECEKNARLLACDCAERALLREREAGREPDERSWAAVEVSRRYAHGEATKEELAAARAAADFAARTASWSSAYTAVRAAGVGAVYAFFSAAAWSAHWAIEGIVTRAAARSADCAAVRAAELRWQADRVRYYFPRAPRLT